MKCPRCGHENENRTICAKCGNFLQHGKRLEKKQLSPEERRKYRLRQIWDFIRGFFTSTIVLILAFIVLSVVMFIVFYFVTRNMDWDISEEDIATMESEMAEMDAAEGGVTVGDVEDESEVNATEQADDTDEAAAAAAAENENENEDETTEVDEAVVADEAS